MLIDHGAMLAVQDGHTHDFFAPSAISRPLDHISHGDETERQKRLQLLADIGAGLADPTACFEPQAWEFPGDFVASIAYGKSVRFHSLNLINDGQIPQLPGHVFVETAATGSDGAVQPDRVDLPRELVPYCLRTAALTDLIVQAGLHRRRALIYGAIELDPTIIDKSAARYAIEACLEAHQDLIGKFA
jgi:alpha-galactosidase/6-phospho-beta-glucosidase family protein